MRICIDLTSLADNFSGIERFALSITKELVKNRNNHWILLFKNKVYDEFENEEVEKIVIHGSNKLIFNQLLLPLKLFGIKADKFFFPAFPAPFFFFCKNSVNTIHDLSCWDCPRCNKKHMIVYFKLMYWKASLNKKKIITVSNFSKGRIIEILKVRPENITVVYNGISDDFNDNPIHEEDRSRVVEKYNLPKDYVLCLSTLEPRKNLCLLLKAYEKIYREGKIEELVLAGRKGWKMDTFLEGYSKDFLKHVHFTGFIEDKDLPSIYKLAKVFVFPSMYEGFGIPPLEALSCGTPVISSDATSLPEVLGKYAIYFESNNQESLINVIKSYKPTKIPSKDIALSFRWKEQANILSNILDRFD